MNIILLNKPYRVLSQFTDSQGRRTLAEFVDEPGFYPAGRLDYDSEGLILLCDDGRLQQRISNPQGGHWKTYLLQLEGQIDEAALNALQTGVKLKDGLTRPARVHLIDNPPLWTRSPPVRYRAAIPTSWIEIAIQEGRNRQLRRMAAAVGFPVLRLVRTAIGDWTLGQLQPGEQRRETVHLPRSHPQRRQRGRAQRR